MELAKVVRIRGKQESSQIRQAFTALNGGPAFKFNEAISFQVHCKTQKEVDYYWEKLSEGGERKHNSAVGSRTNTAFSWQIIPDVLLEMLNDADSGKSERTMEAMLHMKKMDIDELRRAYAG